MSTIGGGTATSGYENLSALLEFVKSPEYVERINELRDQEQASRDAFDKAQAAIAAADAKGKKLESDMADHQSAADKLAADVAAHNRRVSLWNQSMIGVQKAMRGEE